MKNFQNKYKVFEKCSDIYSVSNKNRAYKQLNIGKCTG